MKKIFMFLLSIIMVLFIAACGKTAKTVPYPDSGYPHTYPYDR